MIGVSTMKEWSIANKIRELDSKRAIIRVSLQTLLRIASNEILQDTEWFGIIVSKTCTIVLACSWILAQIQICVLLRLFVSVIHISVIPKPSKDIRMNSIFMILDLIIHKIRLAQNNCVQNFKFSSPETTFSRKHFLKIFQRK